MVVTFFSRLSSLIGSAGGFPDTREHSVCQAFILRDHCYTQMENSHRNCQGNSTVNVQITSELGASFRFVHFWKDISRVKVRKQGCGKI